MEWRFAALVLCFLLSGAASLVYEIAWTQQFALVFGASELAMVTVLASFMAGQALGAAVAGAPARRLRAGSVRLYALLELGIAASALLVPTALHAGEYALVQLFGNQEAPLAQGASGPGLFSLAYSLAVLLVPTACMGATLPLLAGHVARRESLIGSRVGTLYAANTLGAAGGALLTAFVLLPRLGLGSATRAGVAANLAAALLAASISRGGGPLPPEPAGDGRPASGRHWILPGIALSGLVAFVLEVVWTRLLAHLVGGSIYAFGTLLATFLVGLALGSAAAAPLATSPDRARTGFVASQLGAAVLSLLAFVVADRLPDLALRLSRGALLSQGAGALLASIAILPFAICLGAAFPFAVRLLAGDAFEVRTASSRVLVWNTLGAVVGAGLAGLELLPRLGFARTAAVAAATSAGLAAWGAFRGSRRWPAAAIASGALLVVLVPPAEPWRLLRTSPLGGRDRAAVPDGAAVFEGVGRSSTVLVFEDGGEWRLTTNGLPEAVIQPPGALRSRLAIARWLGLLPIALRPETKSMLVVGLGGGVTLEDVPASVRELHVVELEPFVVDANRRLAAWRRKDPLADARLVLHLNDVRNALLLTRRRFDAVVSQPSHPWTSGSSHLFTREFYELVEQRLAPTGVFVQWIGLQFVDEALVRSMLATLRSVFAHVDVYLPHPRNALLFAASNEPLPIRAGVDGVIAADRDAWGALGIGVHEDVVAALAASGDDASRIAAGAPVNTDQANLVQARSPRVLERPIGVPGVERLVASAQLFGAEGEIDRFYLVRRLIEEGALSRALKAADAIPEARSRRVALALVELEGGQRARVAGILREHVAPQGSPLEALEDLHGASAREEALCALMLLQQQPLLRGRDPELERRVKALPPAELLLRAWRLSAASDWAGVKALESELASIPWRHPLRPAATRVRVLWRLNSGDPAAAREGVELLEPLLATTPRVQDLFLRTRLAIAASDPEAAIVSLWDVVSSFERRPGFPAIARQAASLAATLPDAARRDPRFAPLVARLGSAVPRAPGSPPDQ
jgi:spermidine synthase